MTAVIREKDPILEFFRAQVDPYVHLDIAVISDPHLQSFGFLIFNAHTAELWFKARGSGGGFTWTDKYLGSVGAGASRYFIAADMASRPKPTAPVDLEIELTVEAYTDAGYTNLLADAKYTIVVRFIDSTDGTWTIDDDDNFTVDQEGWTLTEGTTKGLVTDYYLSGPSSLRFYDELNGIFNQAMVGSVERTRTIGVGTEAYIIMNLRGFIRRVSAPDVPWYIDWYGIEVLVDGARAAIVRNLVHRMVFPGMWWRSDFWYHLIVPITPNASNTVRIRVHGWLNSAGYSVWAWVGAYFDNVRWIHK